MNKALGAMLATVLVLAVFASWPSGRAGAVAAARDCDSSAPSPDPSSSFERLAAAHVLDREGHARHRRLVQAAQAHANAHLNCTVDAADDEWTTSLWREGGRGWRVAFRTISALFPDDPHVYIVVVDLDDDAKPLGTNVLFR